MQKLTGDEYSELARAFLWTRRYLKESAFEEGPSGGSKVMLESIVLDHIGTLCRQVFAILGAFPPQDLPARLENLFREMDCGIAEDETDPALCALGYDLYQLEEAIEKRVKELNDEGWLWAGVRVLQCQYGG